MAGDSSPKSRSSFGDIVTAAYEQIVNFSDNEEENDTIGKALEAQVNERLLRKTWRKQTRLIEKEVSGLVKEISKIKKKRYSKKNGRKPKDVDELQKDIESIKEKLGINKSLTNIEILKTSCKEKTKDEKNVCRNYTVEGQCRDILFNLDIDIRETLVPETEAKSLIENLDVYVGAETYSDLKCSIDNIVNDCCVHSFFRMIEPYSRCKHQQAETFDHLSQKFPSCVEIERSEKGSFLFVQSKQNHPGARYCFSWGYKVSDIYRVTPKLELSVEVPDNMEKKDKFKLLQTPEVFQKMLEKHGIKKALCILIEQAQYDQLQQK